MTFNYKKQNKARRKKDKPVGKKWSEKKERERQRGRKEKKKNSKSDFAVYWCRWIIMKMKATESGSIREQGNGAETDNTAREKKKKNKRTSVEKAERSVRQYEAKVQREKKGKKTIYIRHRERL